MPYAGRLKMANPTNAEHYVKSCHKCGKPFEKSDQRLIAPKKENRKHFWFLCEGCYNADGVWWVGEIPKYKRLDL